jgi:hypothetical protein
VEKIAPPAHGMTVSRGYASTAYLNTGRILLTRRTPARNGKKGKMKMTRDGVEYTCDKCGKTMFAPTDMCSTMNSVRERMTRDWEEVTDDHGRKRDLCPECSKEYKKIIGGFLKKK